MASSSNGHSPGTAQPGIFALAGGRSHSEEIFRHSEKSGHAIWSTIYSRRTTVSRSAAAGAGRL